MVQFLRENGLTNGYEVASIKDVISRSGIVITTEKRYFALRFNIFDNTSLEFHNKVEVKPWSQLNPITFDLYPNMCIKEGVDKQIFILDHPTFNDTIIFTEEIKALIVERKFVGPEIYSMKEFHKAFID